MADKTERAEKAEKPEKAEKAPKEKDAGKAAKAAQKPTGGGKGPGDKGQSKKKGEAAAAEAPAAAIKRTAPPRLKQLYDKDIALRLMSEFKYKNRMQVPRLTKISLNMGLGEAIVNPKVMDSAVEELRSITGQQPVVTKAKQSIATFKLREGQKIGCMVTLRREKMWEFLDRLVNLALPRVRDFKGISPRSFDGRGNFSLGIREQIIFPEI